CRLERIAWRTAKPVDVMVSMPRSKQPRLEVRNTSCSLAQSAMKRPSNMSALQSSQNSPAEYEYVGVKSSRLGWTPPHRRSPSPPRDVSAHACRLIPRQLLAGANLW